MKIAEGVERAGVMIKPVRVKINGVALHRKGPFKMGDSIVEIFLIVADLSKFGKGDRVVDNIKTGWT